MQVYIYDNLFNLVQATDPKNPTPGRAWWRLDESIGPKPVEVRLVPQLSFFDDWEWVLAESDTYRWAIRQLFDPRTGQWKLIKTRSNYG